VTFLCRYYGVSMSGYYAWKQRPVSDRSRANQKLLQTIHRIHTHSHGIYGSPRVWETLKQQGIPCSENRVARLMQHALLQGRVVKVTRRQPGLHRFFVATPNLRTDQPVPTGLDQQWVGDVTYLKARGRFCYLATVMDVCSRKILGYALGRDRSVNLTTRAVQQAIRSRPHPERLLFHSDRGIEYGAYRYKAFLGEHGIRSSMNRPGHPGDNAHMESFFHSMKAEWIRGKTFQNFTELHTAVRQYIRFYNHHRLHSGLDYRTPVEYERLYR
jgi:transposase InsO family protein